MSNIRALSLNEIALVAVIMKVPVVVTPALNLVIQKETMALFTRALTHAAQESSVV